MYQNKIIRTMKMLPRKINTMCDKKKNELNLKKSLILIFTFINTFSFNIFGKILAILYINFHVCVRNFDKFKGLKSRSSQYRLYLVKFTKDEVR